jgi:hypothetical protein
MLYSYICGSCSGEEQEFRRAADKQVMPEQPCRHCLQTDWSVQEIHMPGRSWGLKGETEHFPLRSHLKGADGKRMVFNNPREYNRALKDRGMTIAPSNIGAPPDAVVKPTKELENHPLFRKMQDEKHKHKQKFITEKEVQEWITPKEQGQQQ